MKEPLSLVVTVAPADRAFGNELLGFARVVCGAASMALRVEEGDSSGFPGKSSLTLASPAGAGIRYLALPSGRELPPFVDALLWLGKAEEPPPIPAPGPGARAIVPVHAVIYIAPSCPHCPRVVRGAVSIAVQVPALSLSVVDAVRHEDLAARVKVKATPTIIIDEAATFVGEVTVEELARNLLRAGAGDSLTEVLSSMVQAGRADDAAALVVRKMRPAALLPLFLAKDFSTRMGALLVMEEALGIDPRALDPLLAPLIGLLAHDNAAVRGDTAALLGKIGDRAATAALRKAAEDPDADVREAAREALNLLEEGA
jgi:glutaredoxin